MTNKTLFLLLYTLSFFTACVEQDIPLIENGESAYTIIHSANADSLVLRSTEQLQTYIQQVSGATIPIKNNNATINTPAIYVGAEATQKDNQLADDEIIIKAENNKDLIIAGGNARSTLYAVYTFLEKYMKVRFYSPEVEVVPSADYVIVPANLHYQYLPDVTTRTVHSRLFYDHPDFADKRKTTHESFPRYVPDARVHTFHRFLPSDQYYDTHPEYYALRNGKRITTQLCLTNEDVLAIVIEVVDSLLKKYPEADVISVSQDDNQQYCQCKDCSAIDEKEGSASGSMIYFVNKVAAQFPDKMISTLAYQYTRKAPLHVKPLDNVLITLCSIECDRSAPIDEKCQEFTDDLQAWGKLTDNIRIWDYTTQFTNFLAPFPNIHTLQPNVQLFRDNNAKWIFEQHSMHPSELFAYRSYLTAKLLWHPDLDQEEVMDDFLAGYYEEAAPFIKNYITTIHEGIQQDSSFFLFLYGDPSQAFNSYLKPELLQQYDDWYDQAAEAVKDKPEVVKRVNRARLSTDYAILEAARQNDPEGFSLVTKNATGKLEANADMIERLRRFKQTCQEADITLMNEMRYTVEEYLTFYERTLSRATEENIARGVDVFLAQPAEKYADEDPQTLTDGALGGANFYANWLGFVGNDLEATLDLGSEKEISHISCDFLQVVNHIVFFPRKVKFYISNDNLEFRLLGTVKNKTPLTTESKINDIQNYGVDFSPQKGRYVKVVAENYESAPSWHHGSGMPTWIFVDEVVVR